jgi:hypothetical protein
LSVEVIQEQNCSHRLSLERVAIEAVIFVKG